MILTKNDFKRILALVSENKDPDSVALLGAGIVKLYLASPHPKKKRNPDAGSFLRRFPRLSDKTWADTSYTGVIALVYDRNTYQLFFQLVSLSKKRTLFQYEVYFNLYYRRLNEDIQCFEIDDCVIGFAFADREEAAMFFRVASAAIEQFNVCNLGKKAKKGHKVTKKEKAAMAKAKKRAERERKKNDKNRKNNKGSVGSYEATLDGRSEARSIISVNSNNRSHHGEDLARSRQMGRDTRMMVDANGDSREVMSLSAFSPRTRINKRDTKNTINTLSAFDREPNPKPAFTPQKEPGSDFGSSSRIRRQERRPEIPSTFDTNDFENESYLGRTPLPVANFNSTKLPAIPLNPLEHRSEAYPFQASKNKRATNRSNVSNIKYNRKDDRNSSNAEIKDVLIHEEIDENIPPPPPPFSSVVLGSPPSYDEIFDDERQPTNSYVMKSYNGGGKMQDREVNVNVDGTLDASNLSVDMKKMLKAAGIRKADFRNPDMSAEIMRRIQEQELMIQYKEEPEYADVNDDDLEKAIENLNETERFDYLDQVHEHEHLTSKNSNLERWVNEAAPQVPERSNRAPSSVVKHNKAIDGTEFYAVRQLPTKNNFEDSQQRDLNILKATSRPIPDISSKDMVPLVPIKERKLRGSENIRSSGGNLEENGPPPPPRPDAPYVPPRNMPKPQLPKLVFNKDVPQTPPQSAHMSVFMGTNVDLAAVQDNINFTIKRVKKRMMLAADKGFSLEEPGMRRLKDKIEQRRNELGINDGSDDESDWTVD